MAFSIQARKLSDNSFVYDLFLLSDYAEIVINCCDKTNAVNIGNELLKANWTVSNLSTLELMK